MEQIKSDLSCIPRQGYGKTAACEEKQPKRKRINIIHWLSLKSFAQQRRASVKHLPANLEQEFSHRLSFAMKASQLDLEFLFLHCPQYKARLILGMLAPRRRHLIQLRIYQLISSKMLIQRKWCAYSKTVCYKINRLANRLNEN